MDSLHFVKARIVVWVCFAILLAIFLEPLRPVWVVNLAYVDLNHAILRRDSIAANRFGNWVSTSVSDSREYDAATYGAAILKANSNEALSEDWLSSWWNMGNYRADSLRYQMARYALFSSHSPDQVLRVLEQVGVAEDVDWLLFVTSAYPEYSTVIVKLIESKGWIPSISDSDQIRLAAVFGNLAWQKRMNGGTQEEILILANKALALNPQDEQGLIEKATVLYDQGQRQAGWELLQQAIHLYPESSDLWSRVATFELQESHFQAAEKCSAKVT